jgi:hypothetical protein
MNSRAKLDAMHAYAYASCQTCAWKLSREGSGLDSAMVAEAADDHAKAEGHRVTVSESRATEFDYRVERTP